MKLWDLKAEDRFPRVLQIFPINKDTIRDGSHHQAKHQVMLRILSSIKQTNQQAWLSFQRHLHQASKSLCFNDLTKKSKFKEETILVSEWFDFWTILNEEFGKINS